MKTDNIIVNVNLWGTCIGKLSWDKEKHCSVFQFSNEYKALPFDICPSTHPKNRPLSSAFYGNLKEIDGKRHFITERFDRQDGEKVFCQTLAAISPKADDYMKICWLADKLLLPQEDKDQLFIRMVFNFAAGVSDDHNKNFSFLMDKTGHWRLSPAYDVMFSANTWENSSAHIHCMGVMGKKSSLTTSDFIDFADDFVDNPEGKIRRVFRAIDKFLPLCEAYGVENNVAIKIKSVLDGLVVDDLAIR